MDFIRARPARVHRYLPRLGLRRVEPVQRLPVAGQYVSGADDAGASLDCAARRHVSEFVAGPDEASARSESDLVGPVA